MMAPPWNDSSLASNGQPIKNNFAKWFGNSKVLTQDAKPLMVYHGSRVPFLDRFATHMEGTGTVNTSSKKLGGIWFTSSKENASYFADARDPVLADINNINTYGCRDNYYASVNDAEGESLFDIGPYHTESLAEKFGTLSALQFNADEQRGSCIFSLYLSICNPLFLDGKIPRENEFKEAKKKGYDGIISTNVVDGSEFGDVYIVFDAKQIKSATDNYGLYDVNSGVLMDIQESDLVTSIKEIQSCRFNFKNREIMRA